MISCPVCFTVPADRVLSGVTYQMCACTRLDMTVSFSNGQVYTRFTFHYGHNSRLILGLDSLYRHGGGDYDWASVPEREREGEALRAVERARSVFASSVLES